MPPDSRLTQQAHQLLVILTERGGRVSRSDLARAINQRRLTRPETQAIERMAKRGLIEIRTHYALRKGVVVEYRAT